MTSVQKRLLVAIVSGGATALLAWFALDQLRARQAQPLRFVDNTHIMEDLLESRRVDRPEPPEVPAELRPDLIYLPPPVREPIDEELARTKLFRMLKKDKQYVFQPDTLVWWRGGIRADRPFPEHPSGRMPTYTNAMGFHKDEEVLAEAPDLRILVAGDSHTSGVVPNAESFPNVLEVLLRDSQPRRSVEALNAGVPGTSLYNYLGMFEFLGAQLEPDVFVVAVYGGNDFMGLLNLHRFFNRLPAPKFKPYGGQNQKKVKALGPLGQQLGQVAYFLDNPGDVELSMDAVASITNEIRVQCEAAGTRLICLYIPPPYDVQPQYFRDQVDPAVETLGLPREGLGVSDQLADAWLAFLERSGIPFIDLRPLYAAADESCYWQVDLHINVLGHRIAAEALAPLVERAPLVE
jgi:lysophospholipase L1-like esterase